MAEKKSRNKKTPLDAFKPKSDIERLASDIGAVTSAVGSIVVDGVRQVLLPEQHAREQSEVKAKVDRSLAAQTARTRAYTDAAWPQRSKVDPGETVWDVIDREGWRVEHSPETNYEKDESGGGRLRVTFTVEEAWSPEDITAAAKGFFAQFETSRVRPALNDPRWIWGDPEAWSISQLIGRVLFAAELAYVLGGDEFQQVPEFPRFCYPPKNWRNEHSHAGNRDISDYFRVSCRSLDDQEKIRSLTTVANRVAEEMAAGQSHLRMKDVGILLNALIGAIDGGEVIPASILYRLRTAGGQLPAADQTRALNASSTDVRLLPDKKWSKDEETAAEYFERVISPIPFAMRPTTTELAESQPDLLKAMTAYCQARKRRGLKPDAGELGRATEVSSVLPIGVPRRKSEKTRDPS